MTETTEQVVERLAERIKRMHKFIPLDRCAPINSRDRLTCRKCAYDKSDERHESVESVVREALRIGREQMRDRASLTAFSERADWTSEGQNACRACSAAIRNLSTEE